MPPSEARDGIWPVCDRQARPPRPSWLELRVRPRGRLQPVALWGGLLIIISQPLRLAVSGTDSWLAFARWAAGLLG